MTKKEALFLLATLKAAYPNFYNNTTPEAAAGTVSVWCIQFADMPFEIVMMAVQKIISTNKFPPTISEIKAKISSIHWEASEVIHASIDICSPEIKEKYRCLYEATKGYKYPKMVEPSINQMISNKTLLRLESGDDSND